MRRRLVVIAAVFGLAVSCASNASAAGLDRSFGVDGRAYVSFGEGLTSDTPGDLAIQPDGRIVLVGETENLEFAAARLLPSGALDPSFGDGGRVVLHGFGTRTRNQVDPSVALQADGRIVIAGTGIAGGRTAFAAARLTAGGALDPSFADGGRFLLPVAAGGDEVRDVAVLPSGGVVLAGQADVASNDTDIAVVRLRPDGTPDPAFGAGGIALLPGTPDTGADSGAAVLPTSDGGLFVPGSTLSEATFFDFALTRLGGDGARDPAFALGSTVVTPVGEGRSLDGITDGALLPDGRVTGAGFSLSSDIYSASAIAVARWLPDGRTDPSFGGDGTVTLIDGGAKTAGSGVAVTSAGRTFVTGDSNREDPNRDTIVAALDQAGRPDTAFAPGGILGIPMVAGAARDGGVAVQLRSDGKLVVLARVDNGGTGTDLGVAVVDPSSGAAPPPPPPEPVPGTPEGRNGRPDSTIARLPHRRLRVIRGGASDDRGVARVHVAVVRRGARSCRLLTSTRLRWRTAACSKRRWLRANGTTIWRLTLNRALPRGRYIILSRATDTDGARETTFSAKDGNRRTVRVR